MKYFLLILLFIVAISSNAQIQVDIVCNDTTYTNVSIEDVEFIDLGCEPRVIYFTIDSVVHIIDGMDPERYYFYVVDNEVIYESYSALNIMAFILTRNSY